MLGLTLRYAAILLVGVCVLLAAAPVSSAATPRQASAKIGACLKQTRVPRVVVRTRGGTVYFSRPFNASGRWAKWSFVVVNGRVAGMGITVHGKLRSTDLRKANSCFGLFGAGIN
jgi:hypothetical protein